MRTENHLFLASEGGKFIAARQDDGGYRVAEIRGYVQPDTAKTATILSGWGEIKFFPLDDGLPENYHSSADWEDRTDD